MAASSFLYLPAHLGRFPAACPYVMAVQGSPRRMALCAQSQVSAFHVAAHYVQAISGDAVASNAELSDGEQGLGRKSIPAHQEGDLHCGVCW